MVIHRGSRYPFSYQTTSYRKVPPAMGQAALFAQGRRAVFQQGAKTAGAMEAEQVGDADIILAQNQLQLALAAGRAKFTHRAGRYDILRQVCVIEAFAVNHGLWIKFNKHQGRRFAPEFRSPFHFLDIP